MSSALAGSGADASGGPADAAETASTAPTGPVETLAAITVTDAPSVSTQYQLPQAIQTTTAAQIRDTVNAVDVEDAVKYFPASLSESATTVTTSLSLRRAHGG